MKVIDHSNEPVSLLPKTLRTIKQALYDRGKYDAEHEGRGELPVLNMCHDTWSMQETNAWNSGYTDQKYGAER